MCIDASRSKLRTNATTRQLIQRLQANEAVLSKVCFSELEKSSAFTYKPTGLLLKDNFRYRVPEAVMYDWFHIYPVRGIVGHKVGCLLGCFRDEGFPEKQIADFMESFQWPAQFAGSNPKYILTQKWDGKSARLSGSASEQLNFLPVLRLFLLLFVVEGVSELLPMFAPATQRHYSSRLPEACRLALRVWKGRFRQTLCQSAELSQILQKKRF